MEDNGGVALAGSPTNWQDAPLPTLFVQTAIDLLLGDGVEMSEKLRVAESLLEMSKAPDDDLARFLAGESLSLSNPLNDACHLLLKINLVNSLLVFLASESAASPKLKEHSIHILRNLSRHALNRMCLYRIPRLVDTVIACVREGETSMIKELALITLNNLALSDVNALHLFDVPGYVQLLVSIGLNGETTGVRVWALGNIRNLAVQANNALRMREPPFCVDQMLLACATPPPPEASMTGPLSGNCGAVRCVALWALGNMTCGHNNRVVLFQRPGIVETVVKGLASRETRRHAMRCLLSFGCADENRGSMLVFPKLVPSIVACLDDPNRDAESADDAFRVLWELASHSDARDKLFTPALMRAVLDVFNQGNRHAPLALLAAIGRGEDHLQYMNAMLAVCAGTQLPRSRAIRSCVIKMLPRDIIRLVGQVLCPSAHV